MYLEGKSIQKERCKEGQNKYHVLPMTFVVHDDDPLPTLKDGCLQEIFKVKN